MRTIAHGPDITPDPEARVTELLARSQSSLPAPVAGAIWEDGWQSCLAAHGLSSPPKPRHLTLVTT